MGQKLDGRPLGESIRDAAQPAKGGGPARDQPRGPFLSLNQVDGETFMLTECGRNKPVTPHWEKGKLRIGCTTISKEAFNKLRRFEDDSST